MIWWSMKNDIKLWYDGVLLKMIWDNSMMVFYVKWFEIMERYILCKMILNYGMLVTYVKWFEVMQC